MEKLVKKSARRSLFRLLCCIFIVFVIVFFIWLGSKKHNFQETINNPTVTRSALANDLEDRDLLPSNHHFKKPYIGHNVDFSDSLCVLMWQKEAASATRDCDGVSDSVEVIGGCIQGRVIGKLFFFKEKRFGLENICRDSTKYLPVAVMTDSPTQTQLWREKSNQNAIYFKSIFEAIEVCAGTILFPEETIRIVDDMANSGIVIPENPTTEQIKRILDQYALEKKEKLIARKK
ncbi:MAG: hypothetical protein PHH83_01665 [Patescibacteria group bacterium]|nr:hypothetical protein [Patescibacteria group bacterium]